MGITKNYQDITGEFNSAVGRIGELSAIPEDLFSLKPDPNSWSVDEIFKHINQFNELYLDVIQGKVHKNSLPKTEIFEFKPGLISRGVIRFMEPPYKIKIKTLSPMYPGKSDSESKEQTISIIKNSNQKLINILAELKNESADIDKIKGNHPLFPIIPMSITEMLLILAAHQRRHFWQAQQTVLRLSGQIY